MADLALTNPHDSEAPLRLSRRAGAITAAERLGDAQTVTQLRVELAR